MSHITLDAAVAEQLKQASEIVELRDPSGRVLGRFFPAYDPAEWEPLTPEISEEELDRREKSDKWYTFDEVMAHLKR